MQDYRKLQLLESLANKPAEIDEFIASEDELNHLIQEGLVEIITPLYQANAPFLRATGEGGLMKEKLRRILGIPDNPTTPRPSGPNSKFPPQTERH